MRKVIMLLLAGVLMISMVGCGNAQNKNQKSTTELSSEEIAQQENTKEDSIKDITAENQKNKKADKKDVVVYFSATGTTKGVAEKIAKVLNTKTLEIVPKEKYSSDDLNYNNEDCRANQEMNDDSSRPEIANDLSAVESSENIYIGFPIWWGKEPRIIQTFLEKYNLKGKKIYLFCTSASSGIDESINDLKSLYTDINIVGGERFDSEVSDSEISDWVSNMK